MKKMAGITLVELMVVISIVAITLTIGVPSMQNMIASNRSSSQAINFVASLNLARSEAVKRSRTVSIGGTAGDWTTGWLVWDDQNGDGSQDAGEDDLQTSTGLTGGNTLAGPATLTYTSTGRLQGGADVTFTITSASGNVDHNRTVQIRPTGRVHVFGEI